jgi:hypothetical protein
MKMTGKRLGPWGRALAAAAVLTAIGAPLLQATTAGASPVPPDQFTCGNTVFTPCNQTAHFDTIDEVGTPLGGAATNCPSFVTTDFVSIVGSGNGIEHSIINNAGDGWFTSTFTGDNITFTSYPPSSVSFDSNGNPIITGPPDANVPVYTGRLTEWFGGSFNRNNQVFHSTINLSATGSDGSTLTVHDVTHANTTPKTQLGPPHSFELSSC